MEARHVIEVFTEGCSSCVGAIAYAHELAASAGDYHVRVCNVKEDESHEGRTRMEQYGTTSFRRSSWTASRCRAAGSGWSGPSPPSVRDAEQ